FYLPNFNYNLFLAMPLLFKENKQTTINTNCELAILDFEKIKENLDIKNIDPEEFKIFVNDLYKAEGTIGAYFPKKDSLRVSFNFAIGQNYSSESAILSLRLQHFLGGIGYFAISIGTNGNVHIKYVVSSTKDIFDKVAPYFCFLYG